jgi:subtilisin family serine protease
VAGIIAAGRDNEIGIDGIASAVQIMTIRAVPNGDERDKDVANAIFYAVDHGAHIINMSFGKAYSPEKTVVDAAVRYADERGVLLVHAAGNDAKDLATENNFPNRHYADGGMVRHWIEVGASGWQGIDRLAADFSNYGVEQVDVFAPGVAILSTAPGNAYELPPEPASPLRSCPASLRCSWRTIRNCPLRRCGKSCWIPRRRTPTGWCCDPARRMNSFASANCPSPVAS